MPYVKCDWCGEEFEKKRSEIEKTNHNFCCKKHSIEWKRENRDQFSGKNSPRYNSVVVSCDQCGKEFERNRNSLDEYNHHFCSPECYHKRESDQGTIVVECATCGEEFEIPKSRKGKHNYCSWECYLDKPKKQNPNWKGATVKRTCEVCGEKFEIPKAWLRKEGNRGRFCSRKCEGVWASENLRGESNPNWQGKVVTKICENCGKEFQVPRAWLRKDGSRGRFCSRECYGEWYSGENHPHWKGGVSFLPYSSDWKEKRRKTLERDSYTCQKCGLTNEESLDKFGEELSVHHKNGNKFDSEMDNLITLCRSCHRAVENLILAK